MDVVAIKANKGWRLLRTSGKEKGEEVAKVTNLKDVELFKGKNLRPMPVCFELLENGKFGAFPIDVCYSPESVAILDHPREISQYPHLKADEEAFKAIELEVKFETLTKKIIECEDQEEFTKLCHERDAISVKIVHRDEGDKSHVIVADSPDISTKFVTK